MEAVARDPGHARALAALAHCRQIQAGNAWEAVAEARAEARRHARRALAADRLDPLVLATTGNIVVQDGDHEQGAVLAARALAAAPRDALAWTAAGWTSAQGGEPEEALRRFGIALRLDPTALFIPRAYNGLAVAQFSRGDLAEAERWGRRAVAGSPDYGISWRYVVATPALQGRTAEARDGRAGLRRPAAAPEVLRVRFGTALRHAWMGALLAQALREPLGEG